MPDIEDILSVWAEAPSDTEEGKCENAVTLVTNAIKSDSRLKGKDFKIFRQGSYENRTNVKKDSDVDIVACLYDSFYHVGLLEDDKRVLGFKDATYTFSNFKNDIHQILIDTFDVDMVKRKNKCIEVKGTQTRVNADVVACCEHRRYSSRTQYISGIEFWSDKKERIINWPKQHYDNGVSKNSSTGRAFKSIVRILKNTKNQMVDKDVISDDDVPSFLIECMVWNVPNDKFNPSSWTSKTREVLAALFNDTLKKDDCWDYAEVSDLKYLFRGTHKWTYESAHICISKIWNYLGYG